MSKPGKKLLTSLTALVAAVSLLTASLFSTPGDLLQETHDTEQQTVVELPEEAALPEPPAPEPPLAPLSRRERLRRRLLKLPFGVRLCFGVPLWFVGSGLHLLAGLLWKLLSPVLIFIGKCLLTALIAAAAVALIAKLLFPHLKLKDIFTKGRLLTILIGSVLIHGGEAWAEHADTGALVPLAIRYGGLLLLISVVTVPLVIMEQKARSAADPAP